MVFTRSRDHNVLTQEIELGHSCCQSIDSTQTGPYDLVLMQLALFLFAWRPFWNKVHVVPVSVIYSLFLCKLAGGYPRQEQESELVEVFDRPTPAF